jgi:hypothetical protein
LDKDVGKYGRVHRANPAIEAIEMFG